MVVVPLWPSTSPTPARRRAALLRLRTLTGRIYVPALLVVAAAVTLVGIGWSTAWGGGDFAGSTGALRVVALGPLSAAVVGVILVVERVRPAQRRPLVARGHRQDALYAIADITVVVPLITALTLAFLEIAHRVAPWMVLPRLGIVPHAATIALVVAMDGCNWFVHLANHRVRALWRFHELHHSQEDLNALTVFRTHPLIHVSYLLALVPGMILVANGAASTAVLIAYGGVVTFAHSNTNLGFGVLGRVMVSPNYHRIHHRLDGPQDVNLGFALTVWDQLFHRAVFPTAETARIDTGLPGRPLAVEQEGTRPRHLAVMCAQLAGPFRPTEVPIDLPSVRRVS